MAHIKKTWYDQGKYDFEKKYECPTEEHAIRVFNTIKEAFVSEERKDVVPVSDTEFKMVYYNGMMVIHVELVKE